MAIRHVTTANELAPIRDVELTKQRVEYLVGVMMSAERMTRAQLGRRIRSVRRSPKRTDELAMLERARAREALCSYGMSADRPKDRTCWSARVAV